MRASTHDVLDLWGWARERREGSHRYGGSRGAEVQWDGDSTLCWISGFGGQAGARRFSGNREVQQGRK